VVDVPVRSELVERAARRDDTPGRSALYVGTVLHHRRGEVEHRFTQEVAMPLLDLGEVEQTMAAHPLWSARRPSLVRFRRADYLGDPSVDLAEAVRRLVDERTGTRPGGPIAVLTNLRVWGWLFNPITCYFCYDPSGADVEFLAIEVTNTPWHERHTYVVGPPGTHHLDKELHVSPFFGMEQTYELRYQAPAERLFVGFSVREGGSEVLSASMALRRQPLDRAAQGRLARHPGLGAPGVSAGIYRQAMALRAKGVRFHPHPGKAGVPMSEVQRGE